MKNRIIFYLVIISFFNNLLFSNTPNDFVSEKIIKLFNDLQIDKSNTIFIQLQAWDIKDINIMLIQQELLTNDFVLVDNEQFADYFVTINVEESLINKNTNKFFIKNEMYREIIFLVQITRKIDGQLISISNLTYEEKIEENVAKGKWYTPFLTTFVIGSLVYLLFYGT